MFYRLITIFISLFLFSNAIATELQNKPNFVWLVSEDSGREYFNLYDKQGAKTPNIERLAKHGLIFENALSNAPVCSVARSTLATGAYASRIGVQYHRAWQYADLPKGLIPISKMLMDDGYYVANNYKTDYNFNGTQTFWHETGKKASWKKRQKNQPFFFMKTFEVSHSSSLHFPAEYVDTKDTYHDPELIDLPPYYPDTKTFRYTYARYLDKIKEMDRQLGQVVDELAADGLLENTFIFFFGDHGGPLP
ncbi:sulfatase-like hydrolase/transferase [Paraglaciecola aquimarina]|uniref:Sulfatase-like hydrolase/transferase n=1 Tax=Paraglaciecola aquimarina TaxID=1235557 RepID=A0ABU3SXM4_9ALTE|nr:sulfatase-like hydrolase/transferase [Paraglaciecola aquimarina]MDU0354766.1 sulfatase-like hydrolase/transferase [Paraglaciecola aquimarina]